jgi:tetratricopeptide (TPR) repeat protein
VGRNIPGSGEEFRLGMRSAVSLRARKFSLTSSRPFEQVDRQRLRSRALAFAGIWFLLAGMLAAMGFRTLLVASLFLLLVAGALEGGRRLVNRYGLRRRLRVVPSSIEQASRRLRARLGDLRLQQRLRRVAGIASQRARAVAEIRPSERVEVDRHRQALRHNELGAQLRREGHREEAAEQHRAALAIVRDLGDRHAEALTLNNLALALVHTGSVAIAVQNFEQALVLFRELGDDEHEGQVIANLGFVRRRQGRDEDAESLLNEALNKLPPGSYAYRQVEEQLRRAS